MVEDGNMVVAASIFAAAEFAATLVCRGAMGTPPCLAALAALAGAAANLAWRTALYDACVQEFLDPPSQPYQQRVAGISTNAQNCEVITWEISYDGGNSWHFIGTTEICE